MSEVAGLVEFDCGWEIAIGASAPGQVSMVLQFDPERCAPDAGVKVLRMSTDEAAQLGSVLADALETACRLRAAIAMIDYRPKPFGEVVP